MSKVRKLPIHLVNKISAGECIERPASVVKELIENAIDAGANKIDIYLEAGGTKLIKVVDNGRGVEPDDLTLIIQPHTTSKIFDENDLYRITTMGFRGEALASIASVSVIKIFSVSRESGEGAMLEAKGGEVVLQKPFMGPIGTSVEVHNLFFNTPARRKFLRTTTTELGHCQEMLIRIALPHPEISFTLFHNNRRLLELPRVENHRCRISDIFGPEISDTLVQVFVETKDITFTGYVCKPGAAKPSNRWQYFFVNRRAIRDRFVSHALKEAYRGLIPHDRYPIAFLFLDVDPSFVDVNVHPTKSEVRFADSGYVHSVILNSIRERFLSSDLATPLTISGGEENLQEAKADENVQSSDQQEYKESVRKSLEAFLRTAHSNRQGYLDFKRSSKDKVQRQDSSSGVGDSHSDYLQSFQSKESGEQPVSSYVPKVLQIHNTYIVAETTDGLMIIDQHALHERILYHQLKTKLNMGKIGRQKLLIPEVINLTPTQIAHLDRLRKPLYEVGIEFELFGPQSVAVHTIPSVFPKLNVREFLDELFSRLEDSSLVNEETVFEHILQSLACKAAIKAGDSLKPEEIQALLDAQSKMDLAITCPHGRPTVLKMSIAELEKQFKRT